MAASFLTLSNLFLNVPFDEKDDAKSRGARWDNKNKLWYAPTGLDPLEFRDWWAFLNPVYKDKETLKKKGAKWIPEIKKWIVPAGKDLDFDNFTKWWPKDLKQYIFSDRFVCHKLFAKSGQSIVFKAWDLSEDVWCAVKLFHPNIGSSPVSEEAFEREVNALEKLEGHENILEIIDYGKHEGSDRWYTVTGWLDFTLDEIFGDEEMVFRKLIRNMRPDLSRDEEDEVIRDILENMDDDDPWFYAYDTLEPILDGLVYAFGHEIIHRDLKPSNIFFDYYSGRDENDEVDKEDVEGIIKLADFGASKNWELEGKKKVTVANFYSAPWTPDPHAPNEMLFQNTWDVFSWGVIAIALVTEEVPETYEDTKRLLDTKFKEEVGENLHTYLSRTVSLVPDERPSDVRQLHKDITKLNKDRRKALGIE
ncbi:DUF5710 domain-containing protein [Rhodospirillales bacterium]|nr:DUF5710 domain-containing protein [Rhodospirillales bacterium]